jgi:hypothetical protein
MVFRTLPSPSYGSALTGHRDFGSPTLRNVGATDRDVEEDQ